MQASGWIRLLRRIPPAQFENLALVTNNGIELSIQSVVRIEEEFLLVRGRLSGSSDAGRAFFIPYDQINFLGFQKPLKEDELRALFTGPEAWASAAEQTAARQEAAALAEPVAEPLVPMASESVAEPEPVALAPPPPPPAAAGSSQESRGLPSKSRVLANLRARLKSGGSSAPNR